MLSNKILPARMIVGTTPSASSSKLCSSAGFWPDGCTRWIRRCSIWCVKLDGRPLLFLACGISKQRQILCSRQAFSVLSLAWIYCNASEWETRVAWQGGAFLELGGNIWKFHRSDVSACDITSLIIAPVVWQSFTVPLFFYFFSFQIQSTHLKSWDATFYCLVSLWTRNYKRHHSNKINRKEKNLRCDFPFAPAQQEKE